METILGVVLLITGLLLWAPAWDVGNFGGNDFSAGTLAWMRLLHFLATVGAGLFLIIHVYLGTVAYPGTFIGMINGRVSVAWAKLHHPLWAKEKSGT